MSAELRSLLAGRAHPCSRRLMKGTFGRERLINRLMNFRGHGWCAQARERPHTAGKPEQERPMQTGRGEGLTLTRDEAGGPQQERPCSTTRGLCPHAHIRVQNGCNCFSHRISIPASQKEDEERLGAFPFLCTHNLRHFNGQNPGLTVTSNWEGGWEKRSLFWATLCPAQNWGAVMKQECVLGTSRISFTVDDMP